jgi:hypothetical protein
MRYFRWGQTGSNEIFQNINSVSDSQITLVNVSGQEEYINRLNGTYYYGWVADQLWISGKCTEVTLIPFPKAPF